MADLEASEDALLTHPQPPRASSSSSHTHSATANAHHQEDHDAADDEPIADFRFLSLLSSANNKSGAAAAAAAQKIPSRGTKDFEPHGTQLQASTLEASRQAMHAVLAEERFHVAGSSQRAVYDAVSAPGGGAWVVDEGGKWQSTVGRARRVTTVDTEETMTTGIQEESQSSMKSKPSVVSKLWLLPEEALWLLERGSLDLRWPADDQSSSDNNDTGYDVSQDAGDGLPMSLQAAYAVFIGRSPHSAAVTNQQQSEDAGLTLEKFTVYQNLKRAGYIVLRAEDNWHNVPVHHDQPAAQQGIFQSLWHLWQGAFEESASARKQRQSIGPLVQPGLYRSYKSIYQLLPLIPYHDPLQTPSLVAPEPGKPRIHYHVYKAANNFRKTAPGPPDFYISVVSARDTPMFEEAEIESLLRQTPFSPKSGVNMYQKLRLGARKVILAIVDQGVTSYINVADAGFGNHKLYERDRKPRGGKRGGGFYGRGGRGRGRGRG